MKKTLLFLFVSLIGGTMYSQSLENEETFSNSINQDEQKIVSTIYGSKASSNANNPCKGATTRVCGKIESELITANSGQTLVVQQIKDADGIVISSSNYFVAKPLKEVKESIRMQTISLGGVLEDKIEE